MKKSLMLIFAATIGLAACNNFEKGPSGTLYKIHKDGGKEKIKEGDYVKFNLIQSTDKDSLMYSSYDMEQPIIFQVPKKTYPGDMNDVLTFFGEGDSATFKLAIDTMVKFSNEPRPALLTGKYIVFTIKVEKVLHKNASEADSLFNKRAGEFFEKDYNEGLAKLKTAEAGKIKDYIAKNNLKPTVTASGLQCVITNPGSGEKPVLGDTVMANYTGKFTHKKSNGKDNVFDTTDGKIAKESMQPNPMATYGPRPIIVGEVVPGLNEGLQLLGKGGKATFILPSNIGFGENGARPVIGPYAPVVFDIEITDIKKASAPMAPAVPIAKK